VYSEILPFDTPMADIERRRPVGIILSGGPTSVLEPGAPQCDAGVYTTGVPVLGICYGMQLMTHALGGDVAPAVHREFGLATIHVAPGSSTLVGPPDRMMPTGRRRSMSAIGVSNGRISEYTDSSRSRRAIS